MKSTKMNKLLTMMNFEIQDLNQPINYMFVCYSQFKHKNQ